MNRSFYIAGVQFRPRNEIGEAVKEIRVGDILTLCPEPDNKFDPNAVQIHYESPCGDDKWKEEGFAIFLGYVPKKFSSEVSAMFEAGVPIECIVESINPLAKPWEMFKVVIKDEEEE